MVAQSQPQGAIATTVVKGVKPSQGPGPQWVCVMRWGVFACVCLAVVRSSAAFGTPLLGDFGAAINNTEAIVDNPANAAFIPYTSFAAGGEAVKMENVSARYPGLEPISIDNSGAAIPLSRPGALLKLTPRLGIGGMVVPPLPIQVDVTKKKLPIILLGSKFQVDAKVKAELLGYASFTFGYRITDNFGLGVGGEFGAAKFSAKLSESESATELATISGKGAIGALNIGARVELGGGRLGIGAVVSAVQLMKVDVDLSSPLLSGEGGAGDAVKSATSALNSQQSFSSGLVGARLNATRRLVLMGEVRFSRADPNQETISLVTFKKQKRDVQDTVAFRSGLLMKLSPRFNGLAGFRYEPSAVGAGRTGADPRIGYGSIEFLPAAAGIMPLSPFYTMAGGLQMGLIPGNRQPGSKSHPWLVIVEGGLSLTESSVGIDETGEMPGAYYYRKLAGVAGIRVNF